MGPVSVFEHKPLDLYRYRNALPGDGYESMMRGRVPETILTTIESPESAARALFMYAHDGAGSRINRHINMFLENSREYQSWQAAMPIQTPIVISRYQKEYPLSDYTGVDEAIERHGIEVPVGQKLFHGGVLPDRQSTFSSSRPLSTSLCPNKAYCNSLHNGKAYNSGVLSLFVITVRTGRAKAFVYERSDPGLGHELEVLFQSGTNVQIENIEPLNVVSPAGGCEFQSVKDIPVIITHASIV